MTKMVNIYVDKGALVIEKTVPETDLYKENRFKSSDRKKSRVATLYLTQSKTSVQLIDSYLTVGKLYKGTISNESLEKYKEKVKKYKEMGMFSEDFMALRHLELMTVKNGDYHFEVKVISKKEKRELKFFDDHFMKCLISTTFVLRIKDEKLIIEFK